MATVPFDKSVPAPFFLARFSIRFVSYLLGPAVKAMHPKAPLKYSRRRSNSTRPSFATALQTSDYVAELGKKFKTLRASHGNLCSS